MDKYKTQRLKRQYPFKVEKLVYNFLCYNISLKFQEERNESKGSFF